MSPSFRRKKKKEKSKDLPAPPNLSNQDAEQTPSLYKGPPKLDSQPLSPRTSSGYQGPPRMEASPKKPTEGTPLRPITPGDPAETHGLTPPPLFSKDISSRPPFPELPGSDRRLIDEEAYSFSDDPATDILEEMRRSGFGKDVLHSTPDEKAPPPASQEIDRERYSTAKKAYLEAGEKHLGMQFIDNAALNYSCAVICTLLGENKYEASALMRRLSTELPKTIVNNEFFQGAKLLLKANLLEDAKFLAKAKGWLLRDEERLFPEDKDLIYRAIRHVQQKTPKIPRYP
ncbi:MAG: hypothetical protein ACFFE8_12825 [Candidatus Heimdallarchaeota archaeon]